MTKQIPLYADAAGQITADDTNAKPGTVMTRDSVGDAYANKIEGTTLSTVGAMKLSNHASVTGVIALDASAVFWPFDATSAAFAPTLPAVASVPNRLYVCKRTSSAANDVTLTANGTETIDGSITYVLTAQYSCVWLFCDGTQWHILAKF